MEPLEMIQQVIYNVVQQIAQACLKLDPGTRYRLETLEEKVAGVQITDFGLRIYICPTKQGLELSADSRVAADVFVSGPRKELLALLQGSESRPPSLSIDGDEALLLELLTIIKDLDLDLEAAVAPYLGDIIAHRFGKDFRATQKWLRTSLVEAKRLADEYIEEELPIARESEPLKPLFDTVELGLGALKNAAEDLRNKLKG